MPSHEATILHWFAVSLSSEMKMPAPFSAAAHALAAELADLWRSASSHSRRAFRGRARAGPCR